MEDWKRFLEDDEGPVKRIKKSGRMLVDALIVLMTGTLGKVMTGH